MHHTPLHMSNTTRRLEQLTWFIGSLQRDVRWMANLNLLNEDIYPIDMRTDTRSVSGGPSHIL